MKTYSVNKQSMPEVYLNSCFAHYGKLFIISWEVSEYSQASPQSHRPVESPISSSALPASILVGDVILNNFAASTALSTF